MEKEYHYLISEDNKIKDRVRDLIVAALEENGGRITFTPDPKDGDDYEYPVSATLWGKQDSPTVDITDVYFSENRMTIYADGVNQTSGYMEKEYEIYPDQYMDIVSFIATVLKWKQCGVRGDKETAPHEITVLFGSDVICEYKDTGEFPSEAWLEENGGVINTKSFKTKEELDAYIEGLNDSDGWVENLVLDDFMKNMIEKERKMYN